MRKYFAKIYSKNICTPKNCHNNDQNQLTSTGFGRTLYSGSSNLCSANILSDSLVKLKVFEFTNATKNKKQNKSFILVYLI